MHKGMRSPRERALGTSASTLTSFCLHFCAYSCRSLVMLSLLLLLVSMPLLPLILPLPLPLQLFHFRFHFHFRFRFRFHFHFHFRFHFHFHFHFHFRFRFHLHAISQDGIISFGRSASKSHVDFQRLIQLYTRTSFLSLLVLLAFTSSTGAFCPQDGNLFWEIGFAEQPGQRDQVRKGYFVQCRLTVILYLEYLVSICTSSTLQVFAPV